MPFIDKSPLKYRVNTTKEIRKYQQERAPTSADYRNFELGDEWHDKSSNDWWKLCGKTLTQGIWRLMAGTGGAIEKLLPDSGTSPVVPNADNEVTITGTNGIITRGGLNALIVDKPFIDEQQIIYVGKHGNDANDGFTIEKAKLTFGSAITAASAIVAASIVCFDNGNYSENITMVSNVNIDAENAVLTGTIVGVDNSIVRFQGLNVATATDGITKVAGTGIFICEIDQITCVGSGNGVNSTSGSLNLKSRIITVEDGFGISDNSTAEIHIEIEDIFITGIGIGFGVQGTGFINGTVQHISNQGAGTGFGIGTISGSIDVFVNDMNVSTGIFCFGGASATINCVCNSITGSVNAYNINATSILNLTVNTFTGGEVIAAGGIVNIYQNDSGVKSNQDWTITNPETTTTLLTADAATTNTWVNGISFDGGVNTLISYDHPAANNWTPVIEGTTITGVGTYTIQSGAYERIGRLIVASGDLTWTAHTGTGNIRINGFPYIFAIGINDYPASIFAESILLPVNTVQVMALGQNAQTYADVVGLIDNAIRSPVAITNAGTLTITMMYLTN